MFSSEIRKSAQGEQGVTEVDGRMCQVGWEVEGTQGLMAIDAAGRYEASRNKDKKSQSE